MTHRGYVALLRGINVGGKHRLAMRDLKRYLSRQAARMSRRIPERQRHIRSRSNNSRGSPRHGPIGHRETCGLCGAGHGASATQMRAILEDNPYAGASDGDRAHIMFLSRQPNAAAVASLDKRRGYPDEFEVSGSQIYLRLINGVAGTKLSNAWFDRGLEAISTGRNWRTVTTLEQLVRAH
jgi:uncharacterized protein (DUF1697 family)